MLQIPKTVSIAEDECGAIAVSSQYKENTISPFVSTWAAFGVRQSISHCGSEATPATAAESGLFVLWSAYCKGLKRDRVLPDRQRYYEHPSSYGQPESADRLP